MNRWDAVMDANMSVCLSSLATYILYFQSFVIVRKIMSLVHVHVVVCMYPHVNVTRVVYPEPSTRSQYPESNGSNKQRQ